MWHIAQNCPNKESGTTNNNGKAVHPSKQTGPGGMNTPQWMLEPPVTGQAEVKTVDGVEYKWCSKCRLPQLGGKPKWRSGAKAHTTSEHISCKGKGNNVTVQGGVAQSSTPPEGGL